MVVPIATTLTETDIFAPSSIRMSHWPETGFADISEQ